MENRGPKLNKAQLNGLTYTYTGADRIKISWLHLFRAPTPSSLKALSNFRYNY